MPAPIPEASWHPDACLLPTRSTPIPKAKQSLPELWAKIPNSATLPLSWLGWLTVGVAWVQEGVGLHGVWAPGPRPHLIYEPRPSP